jgi:hypothetical protein
MKCVFTNCILIITLAVFTVAGVYFALRTIFLTHDLRSLTSQAAADNSNLIEMRSLVNDVAAYNKKFPSPELTALLTPAQPAPAKPAAH